MHTGQENSESNISAGLSIDSDLVVFKKKKVTSFAVISAWIPSCRLYLHTERTALFIIDFAEWVRRCIV